MASGFFLNGASQGFSDAGKLAVEERSQAASEHQQRVADAEKQIASTLKIADATIKAATAAGRDPQSITKAVQPLIESAAGLGVRVGGQQYADTIRQMGTSLLLRAGGGGSRVGASSGGAGSATQAAGATAPVAATVAPTVPQTQQTASQPIVADSSASATAQPQVSAPVPGDQQALTNQPATVGDNAVQANATPSPSQPQPSPQYIMPDETAALKDIGLSNEGALLAANQLVAGNERVLTGLGYGKSGSKARNIVRNMAARIAADKGLNPDDLNANVADFMGLKAGSSSLGRREGGVTGAILGASKTIPRVLDTSAAVDRTQYPDLNKILIMGKEKTGDPNVVRLGIAVNTLVNNYARALGGGNSQLTDAARNEAEQNLQLAWSHGQIQAATDQMMQELQSELQGAHAARKEFISGKALKESMKPSSSSSNTQSDPLGIR